MAPVLAEGRILWAQDALCALVPTLEPAGTYLIPVGCLVPVAGVVRGLQCVVGVRVEVLPVRSGSVQVGVALFHRECILHARCVLAPGCARPLCQAGYRGKGWCQC